MKPLSDAAVGVSDPEGLEQRRRRIHRGLKRTFYSVLGASSLVGLLAVAAVWLSRQAQGRTEEAQAARERAESISSRLWELSSTAAAQQQKTRSTGQRTGALKIIGEAVRLRRSLRQSRELRDEALSALLLPDVGTNLVWRAGKGFEVPFAFDRDLEFYIQNSDSNRAIVRRTSDDSVMMDEPGLGTNTCFAQFSPDGRLAAIAFPGRIGVWDWRRKQLVTQLDQITAKWGHASFDFCPDGRGLWFLHQGGLLGEFDFATNHATTMLIPNHPADVLRLSPSGRLVALAGGRHLEVWNLGARTRRTTLDLEKEVWCLAWPPGEERLAIGCEGALLLWDIGGTNATLLQDGLNYTGVFFDADGDLLFGAGWFAYSQIWDVQAATLVCNTRPYVGGALSADQTRLAVSDGIRYGIQEYLPPCGTRHWPAPPSLGGAYWSADLDPQERFVLTAHRQGWLIRDSDSGRELARASCGGTFAASFSADGSNVLAWTQAGLQRWQLTPDKELRQLTAGEPRPLVELGDNSVQVACFSADRRQATCAFGSGEVAAVPVENPKNTVRFPLRRPSDNSHYLSPDGRWLVTGHHNQHGLDLYDSRAGKFIRTFAKEGLASPVFDPHTGALFTCTATEYTRWNVQTGEPERSLPWRVPSPYQEFLGFAPEGRLAVVAANSTSFHLYDLQAGRDFATLAFQDARTVFACRFTRDGRHLFLFRNDGGITRVNLPRLRRELAPLGLDWSDDAPAADLGVSPEALNTGAVASSAGRTLVPALLSLLTNPAELIGLVAIGLLVTIAIGIYILRHQERLFANYLETEALAERREVELRETHVALVHSEKMKALGTLSAGIAHDFNNLLSVIRLSNELIEEQVQPQGLTKGNFEAIQQAVHRGQGIVNSMLGYARGESGPTGFGVEELISEAVSLLTKPFLGGLVLRVLIEPRIPQVFARRGRVEQMLFNLVVNAAEALDGQGTLTLGAFVVAAPGLCVLPPRAADRYVQVFVEDTGPGIPPEVLPRVFEPFFTTKNKGASRGTGLGLSMLYTMAKEDGVGVAVETGAGRGTVFRLLLPLNDEGASQSTAAPQGVTRPLPALDEPNKPQIDNA